MRRTILAGVACLALAGATPLTAQPAAAPANTAQAAIPADLVALAAGWRRFAEPTVRGQLPDYPASVAAWQAGLPGWRAKLAALDRTGWSAQAITDAKLLEAEMNGLDFELRVLKPWARDPGFYATVWAEQSDVPRREGPTAAPAIDLFRLAYPLNAADQRTLAAQLAAVPKLLADARVQLKDSQARELWRYGDRVFREQAETLAALEAGTLTLRSLGGYRKVDTKSMGAPLRRAVADARTATEAMAAWIVAEAPKKTGPSGVGKDNYNWFAKNVLLSPYDWDQQALLLRRELDRSLASLRLEELRNRNLPPITPIEDPAAYRRMAEARTAKFNQFLVDTGIVPDKPYFRAALEAQTSSYAAPDKRDFFSHGTALDPVPLLSHSTHWIELARLKEQPHADPIRIGALPFNIYEDRSEGFATAMEELVMHAGFYDDMPRAREIVWIMLANRAARGLASLHVQANEWDLAQAGRFHSEWTPRGWADPESRLVGFEQLLYLRQPGYGPSYILGKLMLDTLIADASHAADRAGRPFSVAAEFNRIIAAGILPPTLIGAELNPPEGPR